MCFSVWQESVWAGSSEDDRTRELWWWRKHSEYSLERKVRWKNPLLWSTIPRLILFITHYSHESFLQELSKKRREKRQPRCWLPWWQCSSSLTSLFIFSTLQCNVHSLQTSKTSHSFSVISLLLKFFPLMFRLSSTTSSPTPCWWPTLSAMSTHLSTPSSTVPCPRHSAPRYMLISNHDCINCLNSFHTYSVALRSRR